MGIRNILAGVAFGVALACSATGAGAVTITFDDISGSVADGYMGLDWDNFVASNGTDLGVGTGYDNGTVSEQNIAANGFGAPASFSSGSTFTLNDFFVTGAWNNGLQVTVIGRLLGVDVETTTLTVNTAGPLHAVLNWTGIDEVYFSSAGGTAQPGLLGAGPHFALDNLTVNGVVPEPGTWALMILGFGGVGATIRRRRLVPILAA